MVHHGLHHMPWRTLDYLFIENVGNLVCPAVYDLGQDVNVVALSVTEGEDKPLKYPTMFLKADLVLVTKIDLLPQLDVSMAAIEENLSAVMPVPRMLQRLVAHGRRHRSSGFAGCKGWRLPRGAACAVGAGRRGDRMTLALALVSRR